MNKLLGANWQTTLWGGIFAIAVAIANAPSIIDPLPDSVEPYVKMVCVLIMAASGITFAAQAKSRNVTGGTTQQTADGKVAATVPGSSGPNVSTSVAETRYARPIMV